MDERLTSIESIMWRAGQDSGLRMTIGNLMVLDRLPDSAAVEARLTAAAERAPRLKQRPDDTTLVRSRPIWVEEADYDGRHHLRVAAVPSPGTNASSSTWWPCSSPLRSTPTTRHGMRR